MSRDWEQFREDHDIDRQDVDFPCRGTPSDKAYEAMRELDKCESDTAYEQWQQTYHQWLDQLTQGNDMPKTSEMIESRFLKKEDVGEDGTVVVVQEVEQVNVANKDQAPEYRWTMKFRQFEKPMVMNSTNIKLAEKALGSDDTADWIGKKLIVYNDPNITFGKDLVGGIRIKAHRTASAPRELPEQKPTAQGIDVDDIPF